MITLKDLSTISKEEKDVLFQEVISFLDKKNIDSYREDGLGIQYDISEKEITVNIYLSNNRFETESCGYTIGKWDCYYFFSSHLEREKNLYLIKNGYPKY